MNVSELTVTIKDSEKNLKKSFLIYEPYQVDMMDPKIQECIKETLENFQGEPESIKVRIDLEE